MTLLINNIQEMMMTEDKNHEEENKKNTEEESSLPRPQTSDYAELTLAAEIRRHQELKNKNPTKDDSSENNQSPSA